MTVLSQAMVALATGLAHRTGTGTGAGTGASTGASTGGGTAVPGIDDAGNDDETGLGVGLGGLGLNGDASTSGVGEAPDSDGVYGRYLSNLQVLLVPFGLVLLFFGTFLLRPALVIWCYVRHGLLAGVLSTALLNASDGLTGFVMGLCIGATIPAAYHRSDTHRVATLVVFAIAFGVVYLAAPRHVSIVVTSYGGAFIMFYGMSFQLVNTPPGVDPWLHSLFDIPDLTFSVLSFLIVGFLGAGVQLMLLSSQHHSFERAESQSRYVVIP